VVIPQRTIWWAKRDTTYLSSDLCGGSDMNDKKGVGVEAPITITSEKGEDEWSGTFK
jgi:hypothetical protein